MPDSGRLRLGGTNGRRYAESLTSNLPEPFSLPADIIGDAERLAGLLRALPDDERAFVDARARGLTLHQMSGALGWSRRRVDAVRRRIARSKGRATVDRLDRFRTSDSRHLVRYQILPSGRRCYQLATLGAEFLEVMAREWLRASQNISQKNVRANVQNGDFLPRVVED